MRDAFGLGDFAEQIGDAPVQGRAAGDHRAHPELDAPGAPRVAAGIVGRRRHVDHDRDLRARARTPPRARRRGRSPPAPRRPRRRRPEQCAPRRCAGPTRARCTRRGGCRATSRAGGCSAARPAGPDHTPGVADADEALGLFTAPRADVDVQVGELEPRTVAHLLGLDALPRHRPGDTAVAGDAARCAGRAASRAEMPPIGVNDSRPLSSMFVTATPISSMCPTIASVGAPSPARTRANDEPSVSDVTSRERGGGVAPDSGRLLLVARRAGGGQERGEELGSRHRLAH